MLDGKVQQRLSGPHQGESKGRSRPPGSGLSRFSFFHQILLLLMAVVILYSMADFGRQVVVSYQRQEELRQLEDQIQAVQAERAALEAELVYVQSAQAAEEWARKNGWAREGEVPVVLMAPEMRPSQGVEQEGQEISTPASRRKAWWHLFFGER